MTTLLIVFLFVPITIFAQEEPPRGKSVREQVKAKITEKRLEIRDRVAEVHAKRLTHRFDVYYTRLSKIITKTEERFKKLEETGKDLQQANDKLADAKVKLEEAKKYADESISTFKSIIQNNHEGQKEVAASAKELTEKARKLFMEVHSLIKEAVKLAKSV